MVPRKIDRKTTYKVGDVINCKGIKGVVVFPRKPRKITVSWQGMDDLDDYSSEWLNENCNPNFKKTIYQAI
jgi:hypothetical protein